MLGFGYRAIRVSVTDLGNGAYKIEETKKLTHCKRSDCKAVRSCPSFVGDLIENVFSEPMNWVCCCLNTKGNRVDVTIKLSQ